MYLTMGLLIEVIVSECLMHINKEREAHSLLASLIRRPGSCPTYRNEQLRTSR